MRFLYEKYPDRNVVILGGPADAALAGAIIERSGHKGVLVRCGIPFAQTAAIIAHTSCFIGADSGLTHVAGVMAVPSVLIENRRTVMWLPYYNPNAVILVEPKNCICRGDKEGECYREVDGIAYLRCMIDIPQESIEESIVRRIETHA
jgi:ADP-heptose:LPS heptosyltransferase